MKLKAFGATEQRIYNAVKPIADEFGFQIWDVRFEKEGACWYLRIFIDQESGITIEDCEKMTEPVNKLLDEQDPISQNYILEVGSAGLERNLTAPGILPMASARKCVPAPSAPLTENGNLSVRCNPARMTC